MINDANNSSKFEPELHYLNQLWAKEALPLPEIFKKTKCTSVHLLGIFCKFSLFSLSLDDLV